MSVALSCPSLVKTPIFLCEVFMLQRYMAYTPICKSIRFFSKNELFLIESVVLNLRHCLFPHFQTNLSLVLKQARQSMPLEQ